MTDLRKAAEMALEALCSANPIGHALEDYEYHNKATEALRQSLQRPVKSYTNNSPQYATDDRYTKPQNVYTSEERVHEIDISIHEDDDIQEYKKPWVSLTEEESSDIYNAHHNTYGECITSAYELVLDVEAKLKEKNNG